MATFRTDLVLHIINYPKDLKIGQGSVYTSTPHPGSNKLIKGWEWDKRTWPNLGEKLATAYVPNIWDPTFSGIDSNYFQSGIGDNEDLLLRDIIEAEQASGLFTWSPVVQHGYFYSNETEWFLFSDDHLTEFFTATGLDGQGNQYLQLTHIPKPTIPISVGNYYFDRVEGGYFPHLLFRKKVEFSTSPTRPEFLVDTTVSPPIVTVSGNWVERVGDLFTLTSSGTANFDDVQNLEVVGISQGIADQQFFTSFSPIDPTEEVQVWIWSNANFPVHYSGISLSSNFNPVNNPEVKIDTDNGTLLFGNFDTTTNVGAGRIPPAGHRVGVTYSKGLEVKYEPLYSRDTYIPLNAGADVNPVHSSVNAGFVQVTPKLVDPASIVLTSDLPKINPYLIDVGNNIGNIIATVYSKQGEILEGIEVEFEILGPEAGSFGGTSLQTVATTGSDGEASVIFNAPNHISDIGVFTDDVTLLSPDVTVLQVPGLRYSNNVSGIYVYKVHNSDLAQGIPESYEDTYFQNYLDEEGLVSGVTQASIQFEKDYRFGRELDQLVTFPDGDLSIGKKTIIVTQKVDGVINPHTGTKGSGFAPIYPVSVLNTGSTAEPSVQLTYSGVLFTEPGASDTKSYFVVSDSSTRIRAKAFSERTNTYTYSNIIDLNILIPDEANGTVLCHTLNDVPSGLLMSARDIDDVTDEEILATSGEFFNEYLLTRSGVSVTQSVHEELRIEDSTVAYWKFDSPSPLVDEIASYTLVESGIDTSGPVFRNSLGLFNDGYETTTSGQYLTYFGSFSETLISGTYEFHIKPTNLDRVGRDTTAIDIFLLGRLIWGEDAEYGPVGTLEGGRQNQLAIFGGNFTDHDQLIFSHAFAGEGVGLNLVTSLSNLDNNIWNHVRYSWATTAATGGSGVMNRYLFINGEKVADSLNTETPLPSIGTVGNLNVVASEWTFGNDPGLRPEPLLGLWDEIRLSSETLITSGLKESAVVFTGESFLEWFRLYQKANTRTIGLEEILLADSELPGELPLGFRIKSTGITLASAIDGVTYYDVNPHLTSGYYGIE